MPKTLAHKLLDSAGVHFWCSSGEPVMAGFDYVAIQCQKSGTRTLSFPDGKTTEITTDGFATLVYDINTGEKVIFK